MRLLVINNLQSGLQDGLIYDYLRLVARDGDSIELRCTDGTTPINDLLEDAETFDAVVASGGDGTISSVAYKLAYTNIPILPFPSGTGNLLTANLKQLSEPRVLARMTHDMRTLTFDMGEIEAEGLKQGFMIMAGAGYDAAIMHDAQPAKKTIGALAYFQAALGNIMPQRSKLSLTIDDQEIETKGLGVLIMNLPRIQFDISLAPDSDPRDGLFEIAVLKADNAPGLLPALMSSILDRDGHHPSRGESIEYLQGRNISVNASPAFDIQYDGETPKATTPFNAHVMDGAVRLIVNDDTYRKFA